MSKRSVILLTALAVLLSVFSFLLSRRDSSDWRASRARRLFPFPWQSVNSLRIDRPGREPDVFQKNQAGEWQVLLDGDLRDSLDPQAVEEFSALVMLPWRESAPDLPPPEEGSAVLVTAAAATGESVRIAFGGVGQNLRAAIVDGDASAVYGVNRDLVKILDWPAERFRNLDLLAAPAGKKPIRAVITPGPAGKIALERRETGWMMTDPVEWPVDASRLDTLLRWLENLRAESIAAEATGDPEWFGFTPEAASIEVAFVDDENVETVRRVEIGKESAEAASESYARVIGRTPVFAISKAALDEISLELGKLHPEDWKNFYRQRSLDLLGADMPGKIVVEKLLPTPAKLTLEMEGDLDEIRWRGTLDEGGEELVFPVDPPTADGPPRPIAALVAGLSRFRVKYFLADQNPGPETIQWTAYPAWRFSSFSQGGTANPVLTLYAADPDGALPPGAPYAEGEAGPAEMRRLPGMPEHVGIAASVDNRPAVLEIFSDQAHPLCLPLYRYRSKRVIDSDPREWSAVVIEAGESRRTFIRKGLGMSEQWWKEDGEPLMDDNNRFVIAAMALSQLQTPGFAAENRGAEDKFGLDQPAIAAIVYGTSDREGIPGDIGEPQNPLFKIEIGAAVDGGDAHYAQLDGEGPVFLVRNSLVDALREEYR